mmetsp:Transcript_10007/g.25928  ORF Transcript_10007/g.25928 Transcript_10007/m.25928 type:complete len:294 (-) Transcript_10007:221-1102(-)
MLASPLCGRRARRARAAGGCSVHVVLLVRLDRAVRRWLRAAGQHPARGLLLIVEETARTHVHRAAHELCGTCGARAGAARVRQVLELIGVVELFDVVEQERIGRALHVLRAIGIDQRDGERVLVASGCGGHGRGGCRSGCRSLRSWRRRRGGSGHRSSHCRVRCGSGGHPLPTTKTSGLRRHRKGSGTARHTRVRVDVGCRTPSVGGRVPLASRLIAILLSEHRVALTQRSLATPRALPLEHQHPLHLSKGRRGRAGRSCGGAAASRRTGERRFDASRNNRLKDGVEHARIVE